MKIEPEDTITIKQLLFPDFEPLGSPHEEIELPLETSNDKMEELSRAIWVSNPGYIPQKEVKSVTKSDFIWDDNEIKHLTELGVVQRRFNRKRNSQTQHLEAEAQLKKLSKTL